MLTIRKIAIIQYTRPILFGEILAHNISFLKTLESLEAEDILLLKDGLGTVFYYLIMSLYDMSGIRGDPRNTVRNRIKSMLRKAIEQSSIDESQVVGSQAAELQEKVSRLKSAYKSVSGGVCRTLLNVIDNETSQEEQNPEVMRQNEVKLKTEIFNAVIHAVEILANKINMAVAECKISALQVSDFLSYSNGSNDDTLPKDMMSALVRLYFLTNESLESDLSYLIVKALLMNFSQYKLDTQGRNAMHYAVNICDSKKQEDFLCEIIQLLAYGRIELVSEVDNFGNNPMHYVASAPYINYTVIRYFAKNAPSTLTQKNHYGDTPLHVFSYMYFVSFAKILSHYNMLYRENLTDNLKPIVTEKMNISEMSSRVKTSVRNKKILAESIEDYIEECVSSYQLLLTIVPFCQLCDVKNDLGHTVYDIISNNMANICYQKPRALLQDFSQVSSRLPIYDDRVGSQYALCVDLCFSERYKTVGYNKYGQVLYSLIKCMYDLMSCKFAKLADARELYLSIKSERGNFEILFLLVFIVFLLLCALNIVLMFKTKPILGIEPGLYRSVLFSVVSIVFFASVSLCCFLYIQHAGRIDDAAMDQEEQIIESILSSPLDVEAADFTNGVAQI